MVPVSTCARSGATPPSNTRRQAGTNNVARANIAERVIPFIAFPPGPPRALTCEIRDNKAKAANSRLKRASTRSNFADRTRIENAARYAPAHERFQKCGTPNPTMQTVSYSFTRPTSLNRLTKWETLCHRSFDVVKHFFSSILQASFFPTGVLLRFNDRVRATHWGSSFPTLKIHSSPK